MRIPLDYYRILGLTPQARDEQIQQAHRDRVLSMPRREYSDAAVAARRQIFESAFAALSDPAQRSAYDAKFHTDAQKSQDVVVVPPSLEIDDRNLSGALLLLYELGEYAQVLNLTKSYFGSGAIAPTSSAFERDPDIILTVSLAYLDAGRDFWKQGQYEAAAQSFESGQELLLREGLFVNIRSEIQTELLKLRPYRILELLATSDPRAAQRKQGIMLLEEMLDARRGIDGTGNDYSGLSMDDFLRFIQQLRSYMTVAEQQTLFENEARRPSPVASYLAVYALVARGFSQRQPALIRRAKGLLVKLSNRQDVYLEQAVCALLLGQTEEASSVLEKSAERGSIDFIRQNSEGSPDLLPGLCLYSERWLQEEVFPHFRDLLDESVSLRAYFADEQVQAYLEELPSANGSLGAEWTVAVKPSRTTSVESTTSAFARLTPAAAESRLPSYTPEIPTSRTSVIDRPRSEAGRTNGSTSNGSRNTAVATQRLRDGNDKEPKKSIPSGKSKRKVSRGRLLGVVVAAILLLGGCVAAAFYAWRSLATASSERLVKLEQPLLPLAEVIASSNKVVVAQPGPISQEDAAKLVESWQAVKSKALGKTFEIDTLESLLTEPVLTEWRNRAKELQSSNSYVQYISNKPVEVNKFSADGDDKAKIQVKVFETRNYFSNGNLEPGLSKTDTSYNVEYVLVRKDNKWLIQDMIAD